MVSILWRSCVYVHTSDCVETLLPNNNSEWKIFTRFGSGVECWPDIYHLGAGLAVTGRIRAIGQNVLQSSFETRGRSSPSYCHILFLIAFLEEAYVRNIIIILCINCIITICINDNNAVINNNYGGCKTLFCSSEFSWVRENISSKCVYNLGTRP